MAERRTTRTPEVAELVEPAVIEVDGVVVEGEEAAALSESQDQRLSDYLTARLDECISQRESVLMPHLQECWEIYDAEPQYASKNTPWPNASNLCVALAATYVDQFTAKHVNALRSPVPFLNLESYLPENADAVRYLSDYIDWAEKSLWKGQQLVEDFERERCKIGTAVGYVGYLDIPYVQRRDITSEPEITGRIKHPNPFWVPREDFVITPGYDDYDKAPLVGHRSWISKASLQRLAFEQQIDIDFDKVKPTRRDHDESYTTLDEEVSPYEIYTLFFSYDLDEDGYPEEYAALWHQDSHTILHYDVNKRAFGKRPYFCAPFIRKEGEFDGLGICEQTKQYQAEVTTMHNQRIDNATIANNVMLKGRPSNYITERTRWYPGKIWLVNDINDLAPLDLPRSYRSTMDEESMTIGLAERRIGISDATLGRESTLTNRAAATTMLALMEQGAQRDDLSVTLARNAFQRYGELLLESLQLYGLPDAESSTSPEAILGPEKGIQVRQLVEQQDSLLGVVGVTIQVGTKALNKEMKRQANQQLYGMIMNHAVEATKMMQVIMDPKAPPPVKQFFISVIQASEKVLRRMVEDTGAYDLNNMFIGDLLAGGMNELSAGNAQPVANGAASALLTGQGQPHQLQ